MKTIYIKFYSPNDVMEVTPKTTDDEIIATCFKVYKCLNETQALELYANTRCAWSTLLENTMAPIDILKWMKEAYNHIKNNDFDWLEQNFT